MTVDFLAKIALYAIPLLFAVIAHEVAHGWSAERLGDPTARNLGRITLNPVVHIDLVGTVLLPLVLLLTKSPILFGWAKPVPVAIENLRGGRRGMALVALSGPATNLVLAAVSALVYHGMVEVFDSGLIAPDSFTAGLLDPVVLMARISVRFNLVLFVVNLLPIPPLDGGHVLMGLLPESVAAMLRPLERFGMLILLILIGTGLWGYIVHPFLDTFTRFFLD